MNGEDVPAATADNERRLSRVDLRHRPHQRRGLRDIFHGSLRISKSNLVGLFKDASMFDHLLQPLSESSLLWLIKVR